MVKSLLLSAPALTFGWQPVFWAILCLLGGAALFFVFMPLVRQPMVGKRLISLLFVPFFLLSCLYLYGKWGASELLAQRAAIEKVTAKLDQIEKEQTLSPQVILEQFAQLEKEVAFSDAALAYLGSLYIEVGLIEHAIQVYGQALKLAPQNEEYWQQWTYSHSLQDQGKLPADVRAAALSHMKEASPSPALINLLAIDDFMQKNFRQAVFGWEWLLSHDEELTEQRRQSLQKAIAAAREQDPELRKGLLQVKVSLSPALRSGIKGEEAVFIFVKSPQQSAPLAVVKRQAKELPFTVYLGDEHSMLPGSPLSSAAEVQVVAKISSTGDALDRKGDLRGESPRIVVKSAPVISVIIDHQLTAQERS